MVITRIVFVVLLMAILVLSSAVNATTPPPHKRTLVIVDDTALRTSHSQFLDMLTARGYDLDIKTAHDPSIRLERFGQYEYRHLIILAPQTENFGGVLSANAILDFVDNGQGNVLIAAGERLGKTLRQVASESGVEFDSNGNLALDHAHYDADLDDGTHSTILANGFVRERVILGDRLTARSGDNGPKVLFHGMAMSLDEGNHLLVPILHGHSTSYSGNPEGIMNNDGPLVMGRSTVLVAGLQARNGARMTFVGSLDMLSNRFFIAQSSGVVNRLFAEELTKWSLQERGYLRHRDVKHRKLHETEEDHVLQPTTTTLKSYGVTDEIEYSVILEEWDGANDKWVPFVTDDTIQLEFIMLHPYIRTALSHKGNGLYSVQMKVPDVYGVYKFVVDHRRVGYSLLQFSDQVAVRPLKTRQYERFIPAAFPYYAGLFSVMGGFALFCFLFLHTKDQDASEERPKED